MITVELTFQLVFHPLLCSLISHSHHFNLQNYVLGIVLESDLTALHNAAFFKDVTNVRIVIHGNGAFSHALYDLLKEDPAFHNIVLDDSEEIPIAAQGAFHLAMKDLQTH